MAAGNGDAGFEPPDDLQEVGAAQLGTRRERPERPDAALANHLRFHRDDADDRVGRAIERDGPPYNRWIGTESLAPERLADHTHIGAAALVVGQERTPDERRDPENTKDACGDPLAGNGHGRAVGTGHHHAAHVRNEPGHAIHRVTAIAPVGHVERRHAIVRRLVAVFPGHDELFGVGKRQRPKQGGIDEREDGAIGADAEGKRQRRHNREARRGPELTHTELHILFELPEPSPDAHRPISLSALVKTGTSKGRQVTEPCESRLPRGGGLHPLLDQLARPHGQVKGELFVHFARERHLPEPGAKGTSHRAKSILETPVEKRRQLAVSAASCVRPPSVSR